MCLPVFSVRVSRQMWENYEHEPRGQINLDLNSHCVIWARTHAVKALMITELSHIGNEFICANWLAQSHAWLKPGSAGCADTDQFTGPSVFSSHWSHFGSLKKTIVGVFIPQKSANFPYERPLLRVNFPLVTGFSYLLLTIIHQHFLAGWFTWAVLHQWTTILKISPALLFIWEEMHHVGKGAEVN